MCIRNMPAEMLVRSSNGRPRAAQLQINVTGCCGPSSCAAYSQHNHSMRHCSNGRPSSQSTQSRNWYWEKTRMVSNTLHRFFDRMSPIAESKQRRPNALFVPGDLRDKFESGSIFENCGPIKTSLPQYESPFEMSWILESKVRRAARGDPGSKPESTIRGKSSPCSSWVLTCS
jgi:hypothetical protein